MKKESILLVFIIVFTFLFYYFKVGMYGIEWDSAEFICVSKYLESKECFYSEVRPPLFPLVILLIKKIVGNYLISLKLLTITLFLINILLPFLLFNDNRKYIGLLTYSFYPLFNNAISSLSEQLLITLAILTYYFLIEKKNKILGFLLATLCLLTKEIFFFFLIAITIIYVIKDKDIKPLLISTITYIIFMLIFLIVFDIKISIANFFWVFYKFYVNLRINPKSYPFTEPFYFYFLIIIISNPIIIYIAYRSIENLIRNKEYCPFFLSGLVLFALLLTFYHKEPRFLVIPLISMFLYYLKIEKENSLSYVILLSFIFFFINFDKVISKVNYLLEINDALLSMPNIKGNVITSSPFPVVKIEGKVEPYYGYCDLESKLRKKYDYCIYFMRDSGLSEKDIDKFVEFCKKGKVIWKYKEYFISKNESVTLG